MNAKTIERFKNNQELRSIYPVSIADLMAHYGKDPVLWDVHIDIPNESIVGIMGPNGAGKSTLVKAVLGVISNITGTIHIFGKPIKQQMHRLSYVPQRENVDWDYPITVLELVLMGLYREIGMFKRVSTAERYRCMQALEIVGMTEYSNVQIGELSGGQQQRVFFARSLVQDSDIYFLDEPFSGVDAKTESSLQDVLRMLRKRKKCIIMIHHNLDTAQKLFDHLVFLNGTVMAQGPIDEVFTPKNIKKTYAGESKSFLMNT